MRSGELTLVFSRRISRMNAEWFQRFVRCEARMSRESRRIKGSTRGHVLQSVYIFPQNINKLLRKYNSPRLHQLMQCKELLLSRGFLREGEVLTAIAFFPHPHSLQNLSYKFFLVADIFLAQLKLHLANIGCTWNSRKVNFPHAHESRTRSRFRGLSFTPHPFA